VDQALPVAPADQVALLLGQPRLGVGRFLVLPEQLAVLRDDQVVQELVDTVAPGALLERERMRALGLAASAVCSAMRCGGAR
jgi:hypothetical protein